MHAGGDAHLQRSARAAALSEPRRGVVRSGRPSVFEMRHLDAHAASRRLRTACRRSNDAIRSSLYAREARWVVASRRSPGWSGRPRGSGLGRGGRAGVPRPRAASRARRIALVGASDAEYGKAKMIDDALADVTASKSFATSWPRIVSTCRRTRSSRSGCREQLWTLRHRSNASWRTSRSNPDPDRLRLGGLLPPPATSWSARRAVASVARPARSVGGPEVASVGGESVGFASAGRRFAWQRAGRQPSHVVAERRRA